jgi:hypothetical protein
MSKNNTKQKQEIPCGVLKEVKKETNISLVTIHQVAAGKIPANSKQGERIATALKAKGYTI